MNLLLLITNTKYKYERDSQGKPYNIVINRVEKEKNNMRHKQLLIF